MVHFSVRFKAFDRNCLLRARNHLQQALALCVPAKSPQSQLAQHLDTFEGEEGSKTGAEEPIHPVTELLGPHPKGIIHLPTSRSRFTVLSGPHVHKKSREQFERITRQVRLEFELDQGAAEVFHELLKNMYFTGCQLSVRVKTNTYLYTQ